MRSPFKASVEKWRTLAESECQRVNTRFSPNLVLAIVQQESGGKAGVKAYCKAGDGSYARGLMQCIKSVTDDYNKTHGTLYDHVSVMGGESQAAAQIQLRVGIWLIRRKHGQVRKWLTPRIGGEPAHRDVVMLGDTAYAMGWGATRKKLMKLEAESLPLTFDSLAARFPTWGYSERRKRWVNNPLKHAKGTWGRYQKGETYHPYGDEPEPDGEGSDLEPPAPSPPGDETKDVDEPFPSDEVEPAPDASEALKEVLVGALALTALGVGVALFAWALAR